MNYSPAQGMDRVTAVSSDTVFPMRTSSEQTESRFFARQSEGQPQPRPRAWLVAPVLAGLALAACNPSDVDNRSEAQQNDAAPTAAAKVYVDVTGKCDGLIPCETDVQSGIDRAISGNAAAVEIFQGTYVVKQTPTPATDPGLSVPATMTIRAHQDANCPWTADDCPVIEFEGITTTGVSITADDVAIEDLWLRQKHAPPSTPGGQFIEVPHKSDGTLYEGVLINDIGFEGGRRGARISGQDIALTGSYFTGQVSDAVLVPTMQGRSVVQANFFSGSKDSRKAVNFESQYQSPVPSGTIDVLDNTATDKRNFASWNLWPEQPVKASVAYTVKHNTVVGSGGPAISFYSGTESDQFSMFKSVSIDSNIVQGTGGNAILVDYTSAGTNGGVPNAGQLAVTNNLLFKDTPSHGATNDPAGAIGFGFEPDVPAGAALSMFAISGTVDGRDPKLGGAPEYALDAKSPAIGAGTSATNIGAWQGDAPVVNSVRPSCTRAGKKVKVRGKHFTGATSVTFDGVPGTELKVKRDNQIQIAVPNPRTNSGKPVDVAITTPAGTGILEDAFRYATGDDPAPVGDKPGCDD